ncbi:unnamed protein product, partial [Didymodactylos carnosus]
FLYAVVKNGIVDYDERQERLSGATKEPHNVPSLNHLFITIHLIGQVYYKFISKDNNNDAERTYANKCSSYLKQAEEYFVQRRQPHFQSFLSKSAEIFPKLCVNLQRIKDGMAILYNVSQAGYVFNAIVDHSHPSIDFIDIAREQVASSLECDLDSDNRRWMYVSKNTVIQAGVIFDDYLLKTTLALFNTVGFKVTDNASVFGAGETIDGSRISATIIVEQRLLQHRQQFFLIADLCGKRNGMNNPFHHVPSSRLKAALTSLENKGLLKSGYFIHRPKSTIAVSYMKLAIPGDSDVARRNQFLNHLKYYRIDPSKYESICDSSNMPDKTVLLEDGINFLTENQDYASLFFIEVSYVLANTNRSVGYVEFGTNANASDCSGSEPKEDKVRLLSNSMISSRNETSHNNLMPEGTTHDHSILEHVEHSAHQTLNEKRDNQSEKGNSTNGNLLIVTHFVLAEEGLDK